MVYGSLSWASRSAILPGTLRVPQRAGQPPGAQRGGDFPWYDLLQATPAPPVGAVMQSVQRLPLAKPCVRVRWSWDFMRPLTPGDAALTNHIPEEMFWACTTCGACNEVCPVGIEIVHKIVDGRRGRGRRHRTGLQWTSSSIQQAILIPTAKPPVTAWASGLDIQ